MATLSYRDKERPHYSCSLKGPRCPSERPCHHAGEVNAALLIPCLFERLSRRILPVRAGDMSNKTYLEIGGNLGPQGLSRLCKVLCAASAPAPSAGASFSATFAVGGLIATAAGLFSSTSAVEQP
jgi:hypothetical protein